MKKKTVTKAAPKTATKPSRRPSSRTSKETAASKPAAKAAVTKAADRAPPQIQADAEGGQEAYQDKYLPLVKKRWDAIRRMYHEHGCETILEFWVNTGKLVPYGADYLNALSERTRVMAKRKYRRAMDEGNMLVFVRDDVKEVLRSYLLRDEEEWPGIRRQEERSGATGAGADSIDEAFYATWAVLHEIYTEHRRQYRENPDSGQLCCMWSTDDPPDIIADTEPLLEIEDAFDIELRSDDAMRLYDMKLDEAARLIMHLRNKQRIPRP